MTSIQLYSNQEFSVRSVTDTDGTVWFVAKDIAEALEYTLDGGIGKYFAHVPDCWKGGKRIATPGGEQEMLCLTEQGVYFFLGRSDKPKALPYQIWIAGEVMPSIHATGSYSIRRPQDNFAVDAAIRILEVAGITGNQAALALDKVYRRCTGFSLLETAGIQLVSPVQEQVLTPTELGKQFGLSARRINEVLAGMGYQHNIEGHWEPLGEGLNHSILLDTNKRHSDGTPVKQLKWYTSVLPALEQSIYASA